MSSCQRTAEYWRSECENILEKRVENDEDRDWKALALLTDAYGEWGEDEQAKLTLQEGLSRNPQHREVLASAIRQTGRALAADRSTSLFPIIVALSFFIGAVGIAIFRTASAAGVTASSNTVFINVEAHSIAFSALYFWIIPTVFLSSVIGVSQTEAAIPRILRRFQVDVDHLNLPNKVKLPNHCLDDRAKRVFHGGIYSWNPLERTQPDTYLTYQNVLPILVVIIGAVTSMTVSALVPPDGWDCRHRGEIFIFITWILSASVDILLNPFSSWSKKNQTWIFWITCIKDFLVTTATMSCVVIVQIGVYNRCSCYTQWGRTGLALPKMPDVAETLFHRLKLAYPAITFTSIGIELIIIPLLICIQYEDALRTFVQRDDGKSNAAWLLEAVNICQASIAIFRATNLWIYVRVWKAKRTGSSAVERGLPGEHEIRSLTQTQSVESMATEDAGAERPTMTDGPLEPIAPQDPTLN
ncbi:MAG: hypothetical protein ASARMPREDX12_001669 [Alectoria sarmentosa]|nr:MAG: hypothetical protein ASARMPREDX12_001669 [Alectoria sarmentosa]